MTQAPQIIVVGGPNGAGKTTAARGFLRDSLGLAEFVNADTIAAGLSGYAPKLSAFAAGRVMLSRLAELAAVRSNFAFESTLASRTFAPWIKQRIQDGYEINVVFLYLRSASLAVRRVHQRVREGGHAVPDDVVRR